MKVWTCKVGTWSRTVNGREAVPSATNHKNNVFQTVINILANSPTVWLIPWKSLVTSFQFPLHRWEKFYFKEVFFFLDKFWNSFSPHCSFLHFLWGSTLFCLCLSSLYPFSFCWRSLALAWFSLSQSPSTSIPANPPVLYTFKRNFCVVWGSNWVEVNQWSTSEITMRASS